jgi:NitT/TauT family transport system permease protein
MPHDTTITTAAGSDAAAPHSEDLRSLEAGLDRLQMTTDRPPSRWRRITASVLPPVIFVLVLIAIWQLYVVIAQPRPDIVPGPLDVLGALGAAWESGRLQEAVLTSLERGIVGFLIAIVVGTPIGLLLAEVRPLRRAVGPVISGLQVLPSVAWVPAAIIWFGLSDATVYFVILMGAIPSIVNGLIAGVDQVPPQLRRVGTVLGATKVQLATAVVLPAALPGYLAGLKQGWAFSWRSLMAAEIIAMGGTIGFGLGSMLQQSRELADLAGVLGTILVILFIGILIELLFFGPLERRMLHRRGLLLSGGAR